MAKDSRTVLAFLLVCAFTSFFDFFFNTLLFASLVSPNCVKVTHDRREEDRQQQKAQQNNINTLVN